MSDEQQEIDPIGSLAGKLLQDPDTQKALLDMTQPILQMQEAIFQNIIDQQNKILQAMQAVIDKLVEIDGKLTELLKEVAK